MPEHEAEPRSRRRDSAATRAALLDAAAELFGERGFDRTTVRDIAGRAGVNQALLFRYFGSKDALFAAAMARRGRELLDDSPAEQLLGRVLRQMLDNESLKLIDHPMYAVLRSSGHDHAATAIRQELGEEYASALAALTDAEDARVRADLVLAWLLGIALLRSVHGKEPLASAKPDDVAGHVLRAVRVLLERADTELPPAE
ncbi:helix-turn-helix transcriptional regulator [Solihabitans fulvus]|uniref:Helix-turn-helix transcriptional regulator n=1 Tax=Solihabitans fulvus TaxID=1892852 RepID=A0A5B2XSP9_9PSEU|nr:TetR family transcriptional regulator [Solihabitans fulvus]KAA2266135.1 helix-turn-helix transcriptional regulator [Solihabitans fulvus]